MPPCWKIPTYLVLVIFLTLGAAIAAPVFSSAPTFNQLPSSISYTDELTVHVSFSGDPQYYANKTYYLRGVFYQTDSKYLGFTQNNQGNWVNSASDPLQLFSFTTSQEASWSGQLKVKIDPDSPNYKGEGNYSFKVGRYTASGNPTWSVPQTIFIQAPPLPTPTPKPNPTPRATSQSSRSTSNSNSPSPRALSVPPSVTSTLSDTGTVAGVSQQQDLIDESTFSAHFKVGSVVSSSTNNPIPSETMAEIPQTPQGTPFSLYLLVGGTILILTNIAPYLFKR